MFIDSLQVYRQLTGFLTDSSGIFFTLFSFATIQYLYGLIALKDDPPKWLYFSYMTSQAVFYPLGSIISYYVAQRNCSRSQYNWNSSIFVAFNLYYYFKMLCQFIQECKGENELKSKIIKFVFFTI